MGRPKKLPFPKEGESECIKHIRRILVKDPTSTIDETRKILADNGIKFSRYYVWTLIKKIRKERLARLDRQIVNEELAKFEDFTNELLFELDEIAQDRTTLPAVKIYAINTALKAYKTLIDLKFDAGVFERKLGKITEEVSIYAGLTNEQLTQRIESLLGRIRKADRQELPELGNGQLEG